MNATSNQHAGIWKQAALWIVALASLGMLLSIAADNEAGATMAVLLTAVFPVALIVLGASRRGVLGPLKWPVAMVAVLLEGGLVAMLLLRGQVVDGPWLAGLPLAAAIQIYAMWVLCFAVVVIAYALTFESFTLTESDLERLEQLSKRER